MTWAQSSREYRPAVSILGDSYSTFENYLSCDSNAVWYLNGKHENTAVCGRLPDLHPTDKLELVILLFLQEYLHLAWN